MPTWCVQCTLTTGGGASTTVTVHVLLKWTAELIMDNLAEFGNTAPTLQIKVRQVTINVRDMPRSAYCYGVVTGRHS